MPALEQQTEEIKKLKEQAYALLKEAAEIADKHELSFTFSLGYGMGGYYDGRDEKRWVSSSENC